MHIGASLVTTLSPSLQVQASNSQDSYLQGIGRKGEFTLGSKIQETPKLCNFIAKE